MSKVRVNVDVITAELFDLADTLKAANGMEASRVANLEKTSLG